MKEAIKLQEAITMIQEETPEWMQAESYLVTRLLGCNVQGVYRGTLEDLSQFMIHAMRAYMEDYIADISITGDNYDDILWKFENHFERVTATAISMVRNEWETKRDRLTPSQCLEVILEERKRAEYQG